MGGQSSPVRRPSFTRRPRGVARFRDVISVLTRLGVLGAVAAAVYGVGVAQADSPAEPPACVDAWAVGQTLPGDYAGCLDVDGTLTGAPYRECADGARFVSWNGRYAVTGGPVVDAGAATTAADPAYGDVFATCPG